MAETEAINEERGLRSPFRALQIQVPLLLSLALLPLGLLAVLQTQKAVETAESVYRAGLAARTSEAVAEERRVINEALGITKSVARAIGARDFDTEVCRDMMANVAGIDTAITFVGWIELDGVTRCNDARRILDFSDNPESVRLFADPGPDISFLTTGEVSNTAVVVISEPVMRDGVFDGFASLSFPVRPFDPNMPDPDDARDSLTLTLSARGTVLASPAAGNVEAQLPQGFDIESFAGPGPHVFSAVNRQGEARDFILTEIVDGRAYALGSWAPALPTSWVQSFTTTLLFPILVWAVTLAIAVWALRRSVVQPVRRLRTSILAFGDDRRALRSNVMDSAPTEFHEIGGAFEAMSHKILQDEAELEDKLRERELLVREVYHRVKNNMQLMSSIINMQIRDTSDDAAKMALRKVQSRLASLAKFHQDLYQSDTLTALRGDELMHDLAHAIFGLGERGGPFVDLDLDLAPVVLIPDQAGPLSLLASEAITNAAKYAAPGEDGSIHVIVRLKEEPGDPDHVRFEIENHIAEGTEDNPPGLGSRLIRAFGSQLEAEILTTKEDGRYRLAVVFERREFEPLGDGAEISTETLSNPI